MTTPNLSLPELVASQAQPHVTLNNALRRLDALVQLSVVSIANAPPGSPEDGDRYIVGSSPSGAWVGREGDVAAYIGTSWVYVSPLPGWLAFVQSLGAIYVFGMGSSPPEWSELDTGGAVSGGVDPLETFEHVDDFNYVALAQHTTYGGWYILYNGNNNVDLQNSEPGHVGIIRHTLGNGSYTIHFYATGTGGGYNNFSLDADTTITLEWLIRCVVLPDGTDTFAIFFGFGEQNSAADAIRMHLLRESGVVKWALETRNNATSTINYDNVATNPPVANQWHHLKLVATTTSVKMFVDGVEILENTTNITTDPMSLQVVGTKSAGSNSRHVDLDYVRVQVSKTPNRAG